MQRQGNQLAEQLARVPGSGIKTFDLCPRVVDSRGNVYLWTNFVRDVTILDEPDYITKLDQASQAMLLDAHRLTPEMMGDDMPVLTIDRLVIAANADPRTVLAWFGLTAQS